MLTKMIPIAVVAAVAAGPVDAEVVRFEIIKREPFAGGRSFGKTGPYERIVGRVYYAIDPALRQNGAIVDLRHAPRDKRGRVTFFGDLFILSPRDPRKGNGAILYGVNNRGNKLALRFFNFGGGGNDPKSAGDAGDGFLMRNGFAIVWSGWDGELLPGGNRLRLSPPVATIGGKPITGRVRCEIVPTGGYKRTVVNWANHGSYRPTTQGIKTATLTHRVRPYDPRVPIPREQWTLHVSDVKSDSPSQLPKVELELPAGFQKGHIYELIYEARDPLVHGVCFAGVRDLVAAFKHGIGTGNPLLVAGRPAVTRAHAFGVSQSGRFLREFLYWGFNEDERGRQVFDGVIPHVAGGGLGSFNHRFAQPTRHVTQHDHHDYPADRFPFAYETQTDPLSGQMDGILKRALATKTAPFVLHTQSTSECWNRSGSLPLTDPLGTRDAKPPANVRFYLFGGTQHGPSGYPPRKGDGKYLANPGDYRPFLRALLLAVDRWARDGKPAPPSVRPTIAARTLVDWRRTATGFPRIPGVQYPGVIQRPPLLDFGPRWRKERIVDSQPPKKRGHYRVLVPLCDSDGNEVDCLSPPEVAVPVATYTGWNLRSKAAGAENELVSLRGSYLPFPVTAAERKRSGDPRRSLEERYGSLDNYLRRLKAACLSLKRKGYLLDEDVVRTMRIQKERVAPLFARIR
jgi:Alpha/beta hydrolase domain